MATPEFDLNDIKRRMQGAVSSLSKDLGSLRTGRATPSLLDPIQTRHEVRQMAIGLRMQATPLQMALVAAAVDGGTGGRFAPSPGPTERAGPLQFPVARG